MYPDDYGERREDYEKAIGQRDENGFLNKQDLWKKNTRESGQYHSAWLSMMWPRLYLSRNLLREDGVIFVSIDDNEVHNLRLLMNEVYGEENFVAELPTIMNLKGNNDEFAFAGTHEYTLVYCKNSSSAYFNEFSLNEEEFDDWQEDEIGFYKRGANLKATGANAPREKRPNLFFPVFLDHRTLDCYVTADNAPRQPQDHRLLPITDGREMSWRWGKAKFAEGDVIVTGESGAYGLYKKQRPALGELPSKKPKTIFYKPEYSSGNGTAQIKQVLGDKVFSNPKPTQLLKDFITLGTDRDSLIMDFFAGSGTTGQAVMEQNEQDGGTRRFLLVQMPEDIAENTAAQTAGYRTIADITRARLAKVSEKLRAAQAGQLALSGPATDTGFRAYRLDYSNFRAWRPDVQLTPDILAQLELFQEPLRDYEAGSEAMLTELLLKMAGGPNVLPLSVAVVRREVAGLQVHDVADGLVWLALAGISPEIVLAAVAAKPQRLVVPGRFFEGDNPDEQVSNARLQLADAGVTLQLL